MINVVIIEDEAPARRKLRRFLKDLGEDVRILAECESVTDAITCLKQDEPVDLILSDISLRDGYAFTIYEQVDNLPPIIFITAYNDYLMDAFKTNGIGYLLKPYSLNQFKNAWDKFKRLSNTGPNYGHILAKLSDMLKAGAKPSYKKRFAFNSGKGTLFLETSTIPYFMADHSLVFAVNARGEKHMLPQATLKEVAESLDPAQFFQINRHELVNINFIERLERYGKNSIAIKLRNIAVTLLSSQSKTAALREWLER